MAKNSPALEEAQAEETPDQKAERELREEEQKALLNGTPEQRAQAFTPKPLERKPRAIVDPAQASAPPQDPEAPKGRIFIKNNKQEILKLPGGGTFKFHHVKQSITDPKLAEKIAQLAALPGNPYHIIEETEPTE